MSSPFPIDLGAAHTEREANLAKQERLARAQARLAGIAPAQPAQPAAPAAPAEGAPAPAAPAGPDAFGVNPPTAADEQRGGERGGAAIADLGRGALEAIPQAASGALEGLIRQPAKAVKDLADWVGSLPGLRVNLTDPNYPKGISLASGKEIRDLPGTLETLLGKPVEAVQGFVGEPQSTTGGMVKGIAQFLAPFVATGGAGATGYLSQLGRGGLVSFASFDPQAARLSNLVQDFPALANPVTEYLAADPADSEIEGRTKAALEGLGLGVAADGLMRGLGAMRAMQAAKAAAGVTDEAASAALDLVERQRTALGEVAGDFRAPALEVRAPEPEAGLAAAAAPDQPGRVFVNWAPINSPDDVKQMIQELADSRAGNVATAARGVRTWEATRLSASQVDAWKTLQARQVGQPLNAEQAVAVRELWASSGARVLELSRKVAAGGGDVDRIALKRQILLHNAIQEQVIPARTETARALNAWAIPAGDSPIASQQLQQLTELLAQDGGALDEIAQKITAGGEAGLTREVDAFLEMSAAAKTGAAARQAWYAALLSNPATHIRNVVGNTSHLLLDVAETKAANLIGKMRGQEYVLDGEASEKLFGIVQGYKDAFAISSKSREVFNQALDTVARSGNPEDARALFAADADEAFRSGAMEAQGGLKSAPMRSTEAAFDPERFGLGRDTVPGRFFAFMDTVTTASSRALQRSDEVFKAMAFTGELRAQAYRQARQELASGAIPKEAFASRLAEIMASPSDTMRLAAHSAAERLTFTSAPAQTKLWGFVKAWHDVPVLGDITMPFARTPYNIATQTMARTPLSPFMQSWRADVLAGGSRAQAAWSRTVVGNGILLTAADLAMNGLLTGQGPSDPAERATLLRTGWQPWSVRVGDRYFDYRGFDPIGPLVGLAANTTEVLMGQDWPKADLRGRTEQLVVATSMSIAAQVTNQSFMTGASSFFDALQDPQRYGEKWWQQLATSALIPRGVAGFERTVVDPTQRIAWDIGSAIRSQTPGLSSDLPPARNLWGDPITGGSGWSPWYDYLSPYRSKKLDPQPIDTELQRLEKWVASPGRTASFEGVSIDLTKNPRAYSRYVELAGNAWKPEGEPGLRDKLNAIVTGKDDLSEMYSTLEDGPDGYKSKLIDRMVDLYRRGARQQLLQEFPELRAEVDERKATAGR